MRHTLVPLAIALVVLASGPSALAADSYKIDLSHSALMFRVSHLGVGYTYGRFNKFEGSFLFDATSPNASSVEVKVDVASIDSNDAKRDQHLKSPDFFNVKQFPTMTFKSTAVAKVGEDYRVTGDFTLHGVTKSVTLRMKKIGEGKDPWNNYRMGFEGRVVIKRSEFGMKYMLEGIGDEVHITLAVEGVKN